MSENSRQNSRQNPSRPPGRPRSPELTALQAALIWRCDARARAIARQLAALEASHIDVDEMRASQRDVARRVQAAVLGVPHRFLAGWRCGMSADEIHQSLSELLRDALERL